jgi:hypothetical protein
MQNIRYPTLQSAIDANWEYYGPRIRTRRTITTPVEPDPVERQVPDLPIEIPEGWMSVGEAAGQLNRPIRCLYVLPLVMVRFKDRDIVSRESVWKFKVEVRFEGVT